MNLLYSSLQLFVNSKEGEKKVKIITKTRINFTLVRFKVKKCLQSKA